MLLFRSHLGSLFIQFLDLNLFWANVTLQLLDLVIENKFELFKLLNLLLQLRDLDVFLLNCIYPCSELLLTSMDIRSDLLLLVHFTLDLSLMLHQEFILGTSSLILSGKLFHLLGQLCLVLETLFNVLS